MRRALTGLLSVLLGALLLGACGGEDTEPGPRATGEEPRAAEQGLGDLEPGGGPITVAVEFAQLAHLGDGAACEHMAPEYRREYVELASRATGRKLGCEAAVAASREEAEDEVSELSDAELSELAEAARDVARVSELDEDRVLVEWPEEDEESEIELSRVDGTWLVSGPPLDEPSE